MEWVIENKEWVFSGIGVAVVTTILAVIFRKSSKSQKQKVGNNSTGIQVGGDFKVGDTDEKK